MTKCSFTPQQKAAPACLPPASWVESTRPGPASKLGPRCASESLRWCQPGPRSHVSILHTYRRQERGESLAEATLPHPVSERTELLQASHTTDLPADVRQPASRAAHTRSHTRTHMHTYTHTHTHMLTQRHAHTPRHALIRSHTHSPRHTHTRTHIPRHTYTQTHTHTYSLTYSLTLTYTYPHTCTHTYHTHSNTLISTYTYHTHSHTHPAESSVSSRCRLLEAVTTGFKAS